MDKYVSDINAPFEDLLKGLLAYISEQRERTRKLIRDPKVSGFDCCRFNTRLWDAVIQKIYEIAQHRIHAEPDIAIYAVGSYGRQEMCYYSDIDLVYTSSVDLEEVYDEKTLDLIRLFYDFIDGLSKALPGVKFSFIYRPFVDIDRWNYQDITALIDMRFLAGDSSLTLKLKNTVRSRKYDISIVLDLLQAKEEAFKKFDDTLYLNQPNVKEGRGGLRTLQYALWMFGLREFVSIPDLYEVFNDDELKCALDFMLKIRNLLHLFADAPRDVLSYLPEQNDLIQQQAALAMGYPGTGEAPIYGLMADYYKHAKYLHLRSELLIGDLIGFGIHISETLGVKQSHIFCIDGNYEAINANELFQLFSYFQQYDFELDAPISTFIFTHVDRLDLDAFKGRMAELMARPGKISKSLSRMQRLGITGRILPEFEKAMLTRSERSADPYTVGKHTIVAIGYLDKIRQADARKSSIAQQPDAAELVALNAIYQQLSDPSVIYMALLLHDIDKPSPDHSRTGAEKARRIAKEFGFSDAQVSEICFLIGEHLTMITLTRYHQWDEEKIVAFHQKVRSLKRLMQLYLMTYCDSRANGEQNFTCLDRDNLKRLYGLIRARIVGREEEQWCMYADPDEFRAFLQQMPISYRIAHSPQEIATHIRLVKEIEAQETQQTKGEPRSDSFVFHFVDQTGFTELYLCNYDRVGHMHQVSGLFFAHHIDVREARTYTKRDTKVAVEIYRIVHQPPYLGDSQPSPLDEELKKKLIRELRRLRNNEVTLDEIFARQRIQPSSNQWKVYDVQVNAEPHKNYSEIVVKAREQIGFLYFFSGILAELGLNIEMCKCSGLGRQVTNRFYLTPIADPESIRQQIMEKLKS
jgi:[protein-PII] uridylyltransferase